MMQLRGRKQMKNRKHRHLNLWRLPWLAPLVLLMLLSVQGCSKEAVSEKQEDSIRSVKLYTVTDVTKQGVRREFPGITKASEEADLAFRVPGPLLEFPIEEGQEVKKGDLLARLDPRDYETAVQQVSASLQGMRAQLKAMRAGARHEQMQQLKANVRARQAQVNEVKMRYERHKNLFNSEIISRQQLDAVKAEFDVALSQLEAAEEQLKEGEQGARPEDVEAQQSQIRMFEAKLRDVKSKLSDTELRAPFDGVVARTYVKNFEDIAPKQPILRIQALSQIEIEIHVPEADMAQIGALGITLQQAFDRFIDETSARFPAYPERDFTLDLKAYETDPDPATQTYRITMVMEQPADVKISPGMNVNVHVTGPISAASLHFDNPPVFLIPSVSVFADRSGQSCVWIVNPDTQRVTQRPVELGNWRHESIEVLDGLKANDTIAVSAVQMLQAGVRVEQMKDLGEL